MSAKGDGKKTTARTTVKDLAPKKAREAKIKGGSDQVYRPGCNINHNETLLLDADQAAR